MIEQLRYDPFPREYATLQPATRNRAQEYVDRIEEEKFEPFWSYYLKYSPKQMLIQFRDSKDEVKQWDFIPAEQYHNLLKRYMDDPIGARIPDNVVTDWIRIIYRNLAQIISIEKLFGRLKNFPYDDVEDVLGKLSEPGKLRLGMGLLSGTGFYKWAVLPSEHPGWSDFGFFDIYTILKEYKDDMEPGEKLILVNRCLDVTHYRGYMEEYFLEGGRGTSEKIFGFKGDADTFSK